MSAAESDMMQTGGARKPCQSMQSRLGGLTCQVFPHVQEPVANAVLPGIKQLPIEFAGHIKGTLW